MSEKMIVACPECQTRFVAPLEKFLPDGRKVRCAKCGHAWFQRAELPEGVQSSYPAEMGTPDPTTVTAGSAAAATGAAAATAAASSSASSSTSSSTGPSVIERAEQRRAELAAREPAGGVGTTSVQEVTSATGTNAATSAGTATSSSYDPMPQTARIDTPAPRRSVWPRLFFYTAAAAIIAGVVGYLYKDPISAKVPALAPTLAGWHETVDGMLGNVVPANRTLKIENVKYDFEEIEGGKALLLSAEVVNEGSDPKDAPKLTVKIMGKDNTVLKEVEISPEDMSTKVAPSQRTPYFVREPFPPEDLERVEVDFAGE